MRFRSRHTRPGSRPLLLLSFVASLSWCMAAEAEPAFSPDQVEGPVTWGGVSNVTHLSHLWFAGQPDQAALVQAKASGVSVVINLRDPSEQLSNPSETEWEEESAVTALGMTYYNVPVRGGEPFDPAAFARIEDLLKQHHEQPILLHCSSSNRVGGWLATHLVETHGMTADQAIAVGRRAGITKEPVEQAVRAYLTRSASAVASPGSADDAEANKPSAP